MISTLPPLVRNNGGGFWNHDFFWKIMGPAGSTKPSGALAEAIDAYGGLDKLKDDFNTKGAGQFGSGWAWVIKDESGALKVVSTPNRRRETSSWVTEPPYSPADATMWSPAPTSDAKVMYCADRPLEVATAPSPPSRLAIRSSNAATVGLATRE